MRNFYLLTVFTAISIGLANLFFFYPGIIASIPYGTFTFGFATLICFWVAIQLGKQLGSSDQSVATLVNTMRSYFWVMGAFFFFDGIAHVGIPALYPVDVVASHMHTFSHAFFFLGNAIIIRIPVSFINARWANGASAIMGGMGVLAVIWRFINIDHLVYIFGAGRPPIVVVDQTSDIIFLVANGLALLVPGLYLVFKSMGSGESETRVRALLLGLGMGIFFAIGPVIDLVQNQYTQLLIHLLQATSFYLMGASVLYMPRNKAATAAVSPLVR